MKKETASAIVLTLLMGTVFFSAIGFAKGQTDIHDLEASFSPPVISGTHSHLSHGNSTVLNVTVTNRGNVNESNVSLEFLINNIIKQNSTTDTLAVNSTFPTTYTWSPIDGDYNLTVYVPPVTGETNIANNNVTWWVRVGPDLPPIASFNATWSPFTPAPGPVSSYSTVTFDASNSSDPVNQPDWSNVTYYTWNFGDTPNNVTNPYSNETHMYAAWGNWTVTLTVRNAENLNGSASKNITVYAQPVASFTIDPPWPGPYYVNDTLTFNVSASYDPDNMTAPNRGIANYTWDFNDTARAMGPNVTHSYNNSGNYNVHLTVIDCVGLANVTTVVVIVSLGNPMASFTFLPRPCYVGHLLTFDASASSAHNSIANYTWDFNDGTLPITVPYPNSTITYRYNNSGNYNVNLTVTDAKGLTGYMNKTVNVSFEVFVSVVDASTGNTTINTYNPGQTFTVNITVTNVQNLYSYYFKLSWPPTWLPPTWLDLFDPYNVNITYPPDGFIGPRQDKMGNKRISFYYDPSHIDEGYMFVNGTLLVDEPYSGNGTLAQITFEVLTSGNCTLALSDIVLSKSFQSTTPINNTVEKAAFYTSWPVANFTYKPPKPAPGDNVTFDASASYDPDNPTNATNHGIANYSWDFNDGSHVLNTTEAVVEHPFASGRYTVNLTVTDYDNGDHWWYSLTIDVNATDDIAILDIKLSPTDCYDTSDPALRGAMSLFNVSITLENHGNVPETFNVTTFYNDTYVIDATTVTLSPGNETTIIVNWNVTGLLKGSYKITANATLPGDVSPADNMANCTQKVGLPCDINGDGTVDIYDAITFSSHFNTNPTSRNWLDPCDLNEDEVADIYDSIILSGHFGQSIP